MSDRFNRTRLSSFVALAGVMVMICAPSACDILENDDDDDVSPTPTATATVMATGTATPTSSPTPVSEYAGHWVGTTYFSAADWPCDPQDVLEGEVEFDVLADGTVAGSLNFGVWEERFNYCYLERNAHAFVGVINGSYFNVSGSGEFRGDGRYELRVEGLLDDIWSGRGAWEYCLRYPYPARDQYNSLGHWHAWRVWAGMGSQRSNRESPSENTRGRRQHDP